MILDNYNKKHGFTLIELLAVIVILGIILAIAVPSVVGIIENPLKNPKGGYFDNSKPNGVKVIVSRINNDPLQYGYEIIAPNEGPKEILAIDFSDYYDACPGPIYLSSTAANTDGKFHVSWTGNVIDFEVIVSDPSISKTITSTNQEIFDIKKGATIDLIIF